MKIEDKYILDINILRYDYELINEYNYYYKDELVSCNQAFLSIKVFEYNRLISNALINIYNDGFDVENSILINNEQLIIQTDQTVFCLNAISLELEWQYKDLYYCFNGLKLNEGFYYVFGFDIVVILDLFGNCISKLIEEN